MTSLKRAARRAGERAVTSGKGGEIAVIFVSARNGLDEPGYAAAGAAMEALAATQPGFVGVESVRGTDGVGITVSYWRDLNAASAWRDHPEHRAIREAGRERWYDWYRLTIAQVQRGYDWKRP
jgi:heme-degrading monooxygenase HmoA